MEVRPYLLDHESLARRVPGVAYVVTMPRLLGYRWTEMVGKPWSAFWGAVRTYRPGINFEQDSPADHPRALAERVLSMRYGNETMEKAFEQLLVDRAFEHTASRRVDWGTCLFLADARQVRAELARSKATDADALHELYEEEIASWKGKAKGLEHQAEEALDLASQMERERDQAVAENHQLRARIEALEAALSSRKGRSPDVGLPAIDSYDGLPEWVSDHLVGRLVLHPRAINQGLKSAAYEDLGKVRDALLVLAGDYRNMRLGIENARQRFETRLNELGLRCDGSISEERAGEEGDTYFVRHPYASSPRRFIDLHLRTRGNSRDPKRCLAIYFFWDDETRQVVVCWLPAHLQNRMT